jgi:hypothetical protein
MSTTVKIFAVILIATQLTARGSALDFSALLHEFRGEGIVYHRLIFKDDKRDIFYQPPAGWGCTASDNQLRLVPAGKAFAEAQIRFVPMENPVPLDEKAASALTQQVIKSAPPGSQQVAIVSEVQNGLLLGNNPTFEVVASYKAMGETFQRSVLFVNAPGKQLVFQLSSRKSDFDALYRAFRASILTWEWQETPSS